MLEESWPHIQIVYELLLRLIILKQYDAKTMLQGVELKSIEPQFTNDFVLKLIGLFQSPDPRERDYLKTIMHRLYAKCVNLRLFIRQNIFIIFVDESRQFEKAYGISEILEIFIAIVNGYNSNSHLKPEHLQLFEQCLMPLYKMKYIDQFRQQFSKALQCFINRDESLSSIAILSCLKYWPIMNPTNEVASLTEIESIISLLKSTQYI